jgi:hypothetical protein
MLTTPQPPKLRHIPELDPDLLPASLWIKDYEGLCVELGICEVTISLLRSALQSLSQNL